MADVRKELDRIKCHYEWCTLNEEFGLDEAKALLNVAHELLAERDALKTQIRWAHQMLDEGLRYDLPGGL